MPLAEYREVRDWINEPLSDDNRMFRLRCIGRAFGLSEHYLVSRYMPKNPDQPNGMGYYLQLEIIMWVRLHPDLQMNNPQFIETDWNELNVDGD